MCALHNALLASVYFAAARFGLMLDAVSGFATLVWPASGIALAAVVVLGPRMLLGVAAGAFLANWVNGAPPLPAAGIAAGNMLEAGVAGYLLARLCFRWSLDRVRDVLALILVAAVGCTLISATLGVASLYVGGVVPGAEVLATFHAWWIGDMIGVLVVAPPLMVFAARPRTLVTPARWIEATLLMVGVALATLFAFHEWRSTVAHALSYTYVLFPLLMWAGLRFEQVGVSSATLFASAVAVYGAIRGFGPFTRGELHENLLYLQAFMGVVALTGLFLGAVTAERRRAREALAGERNELGVAQQEAQRHAARVQLLADASQSFAEASLDLPRALARIARTIGDTLGDSCVIGLFTADAVRIEAAAVYHADAEMLDALLDATREPWPLDQDPFRSVLRSGEPLLIADLSTDPRAAVLALPDCEYLERHPLHSVLAVPLCSHAQVIGYIVLGRYVERRPYSRDDKLLLCDVAERAALAIENARLYQQAQESVRLRDDFLAVASHELRTPLSASVLQLSSLRRLIERDPASPTTAGLLTRLDKAMRANERLSKLVDSLLDVSSITTQRFELQREQADLAQIARDTVRRLQPEARANHCELRLHVDSTVTGYWDRMRLEQVLTHLLSNAIKYGQGQPIEIDVHGDDERAVLSVRDYGIGISRSDAERIFMRFERAVPVRNYGGLGLGLYIARQIVEAHGGQLRVASELQTGAAFALELPRWPAVSAAAARRAEQRV